MTIIMIIIWLVVFAFFLGINLAADSASFGAIAGLWLLILGIFILVNGIQVETGITITEINDTSSAVVYTYADVISPVTQFSYDMIWGIIIILSAGYMLYCNAEELL